jgi:hypothetical protein
MKSHALIRGIRLSVRGIVIAMLVVIALRIPLPIRLVALFMTLVVVLAIMLLPIVPIIAVTPIPAVPVMVSTVSGIVLVVVLVRRVTSRVAKIVACISYDTIASAVESSLYAVALAVELIGKVVIACCRGQ